mmetsp:Transcript_35498/g.56811  ORF Transcript_35498/g.56811 Transcript_35498/m.56811 type:complete len:237 (-) Transcript_35498:1562-2272(-)
MSHVSSRHLEAFHRRSTLELGKARRKLVSKFSVDGSGFGDDDENYFRVLAKEARAKNENRRVRWVMKKAQSKLYFWGSSQNGSDDEDDEEGSTVEGENKLQETRRGTMTAEELNQRRLSIVKRVEESCLKKQEEQKKALVEKRSRQSELARRNKMNAELGRRRAEQRIKARALKSREEEARELSSLIEGQYTSIEAMCISRFFSKLKPPRSMSRKRDTLTPLMERRLKFLMGNEVY